MAKSETKPRSRSARPVQEAGAARWLPLAAIALATVVLFRGVLLEGMTFVSPDATAPLGFVRVGEASLAHGVYPLWNPYIFSGMPSFASLAYNPYIYPPDWPLALVGMVVPLPDMFWLVLYYFLGGVGLYLLCREWGAGRLTATLGGVAFLSMPNLVAVGAHGHGSQLVDSAYIPWMLWLAARIFRRRSLLDLACLGLAAGFQLLRGHVQVCYYTWLALGLYGAVEVLRPAAGALRERLLGLAGMSGALGLGAGMAAFLYLPVREYARHSIRGAAEGGGVALEYATQWSFHPVELLTFLIPGVVGFGGHTYWGGMPFTDYPHYMGLALFLVALYGLLRTERRAVALFLSALAVFSLALAFGKNSFVYNLFFDHLPYFNKFRVPVMILVLLQVSFAVAAALGLERLVARPGGKPPGDDRLVPVMLGVAAVVLGLGLLPDLWRSPYQSWVQALRPGFPQENLEVAFAGATRDAVRVGLLALVALGGVVLARRGTMPGAAAVALFVAVTAADLWIVDQRILDPVLGSPVEARRELERDDVVSFFEAQAGGAPFRIVPVQEFQSNRYAGFSIASLGGYHAAKPKIAQDYIERGAQFTPLQNLLAEGRWVGDAFWNVANVRYTVVPGAVPEGSPLIPVHQGSQVVYENPRALPRASLAVRYEVLPAEQHLDRLLLAEDHDEHQVVLLEREPEGPVGPDTGSVRIVEYGLNRVRMETEAPNAVILRFADLYFPGWRATVDGQEVPILRADHAFRAIVVPAGSHRVEWTYQSDALRQGIVLAVAASATILVLLALGLWRRRTVRA